MKFRRGQAAWIVFEALHQLGRIATLLVLLAVALVGLLAYRLSQGPLEIPKLASAVATRLTGEGINVHAVKAELAWAGYHKGGAVPFVLRLAGITVRTDSGTVLATVPAATVTMPVTDLLGGRDPVLLSGENATFPAGNVAVSWYANLWPGPGFTLSHGAVYVSIGPGVVGYGTNKVALSRAGFVLAVSPKGDVTVSNGVAQLQQQGQSAPRLTFSMNAHRNGLWLGRLDARLDSVQAQDLAAIWPPDALKDTRDWVTHNITAGTARDAHFAFDMAAAGDLSQFRVVNVQGQFNGDDMTLSWLTGAVPVEHMNGVFRMPGMDTAVITASSGKAGGIHLNNASFVITDMTAKDQFGNLTLDLSGRLQDALAILGAPPLNLLDHTPPEIKNATGTAQGTLQAFIPFKKDLQMEEVRLNVVASLADVRMETLIPGIGFTNGKVALTTDGHSLHADATADFAGKPSAVTVDQDVSNENGSETLAIAGTAGPVIWHAFGLDTPNAAAQGSVPFKFTMNGPPDGLQQADLDADLTPAGLSLPLLGWQKSPGSAGHLGARFTLNGGQLGDIQSLVINAPSFLVRGHSQKTRFLIDQAEIGRTQGSVSLTEPAGPGAPWILNASGAALDLRPSKLESHAASRGKPDGTPSNAAGPLWAASLSFQKVYFAKPPAPPLSNLSITASGQGYDVQQANGEADGAVLSISPLAADGRHLTLQGRDAGTLLQVLDLYDGMRGGTLDLQADYGGGLAKGTMKLAKVRLVNAPGFIKLLQAVTLYGVAEVVTGPGLLIEHAVIPFTLQDNVLNLHGADAYSESLGFTASGTINTVTGICNLDTTIVPAYAINSLPGRIPLIGRLFSAEKGGGLFAMRAHLEGDMTNPSIHANPLSAVAPGFLRGIFGLGEAAPKAQPK